MAEKCTGGGRTQIEVEVPTNECECVGIKSWVNNGDGTTTVTLTNGQSITYISQGPPGTPGAPGEVEAILLYSEFPGLATLGTAFESLMKDRVPYVLPANKLATDGSKLKLRSVFTSLPNPDPTQLVKMTFNGAALNNPLNIGFKSKITTKIIYEAILTRISAAELKVELIVYFCDDSISGHTYDKPYVQNAFSIAGLDLVTNSYNIDAQADSDVIGDITLESADILYLKK